MKDERGLYYYPDPSNVAVRVYVRQGEDGEVEFRLWQKEHPEVWEKHGWLGSAVIREAASMYQKLGRSQNGADPMRLYDNIVAKALLKDETS